MSNLLKIGDLTMRTRVLAAANVHWRASGDEVVLLDFSGGEYFALDQVGAEIWQLLQDGAMVGEIVTRVVERYAVSQAQAEVDVVDLLAELLKHSLIITSDSI